MPQFGVPNNAGALHVAAAYSVPLYIALQISLITLITHWFDVQFANMTLERFFIDQAPRLLDFSPSWRDHVFGTVDSALDYHFAQLSVLLMGNTLIVLVADLIVISISVITISRFVIIIRSYLAGSPSARRYIAVLVAVWATFFIYNGNLFWHVSVSAPTETHFKKVTLDYQLSILNAFNAKNLPAAPQEQVDRKGMYDETCSNKYCIQNLRYAVFFYWISLGLVIFLAVAGVLSGALTLSPFEVDSGRSSRLQSKGISSGEPPGSSASGRDLQEYRKRVEDLRTVLYYGSASLAAAVLWMGAHARWAVSPFFDASPKLEALVNVVMLHITILYLVILAVAFVPPSVWLREKLRRRYYQDLEKDGGKQATPFPEWASAKGVDTAVLSAKDMLAFVAPLVPILLSATLDTASLGKLVSGQP